MMSSSSSSPLEGLKRAKMMVGGIREVLEKLELRKVTFLDVFQQVREVERCFGVVEGLVERREKEVRERSRALEEKERSSSDLADKLDELSERLSEQARVLKEREERIEFVRGKMDGVCEEVEKRGVVLGERVRRVEEKEEVVEGREKEVDRWIVELESREREMEECVKEVGVREREIEDREEVVERKEVEIEERGKLVGVFKEREVGLEKKEKEIEERLRVVVVKEKLVDQGFQGLEMVEKELDERCREVEVKEEELKEEFRVIELKEKEVEERLREVEVSAREVDERRRVLDLREKGMSKGLEVLALEVKEIEEYKNLLEMNCSKVVEMREEEMEEDVKLLELKMSKIQERYTEVELKEKEVEELRQAVELKEKQIDERSKVVEWKDKRLIVRHKALEMRNKELFEREADLELKERQCSEGPESLESKEKQFNDQFESLELKKKEVNELLKAQELKAKEINDCSQKLELMKEKLKKHYEAKENEIKERFKELKLAESRSSNADESEVQLRKICLSENGKALQMFLNERVNEHQLMGQKVANALRLSDNSPKLVLAAVEGFFSPQSTKGNVKLLFDPTAVRSSCVLLLEQLVTINPSISEAVLKDANNVARYWRERLMAEGEIEIVILGFLMLLVAYDLGSNFRRAELQRLYEVVYQHRLAPDLCLRLGLSKSKKVITALAVEKRAQYLAETPKGPGTVGSSSVSCATDIRLLCINTDVNGMSAYLIKHVKECNVLHENILDSLLLASDPTEFVLDVTQSLYKLEDIPREDCVARCTCLLAHFMKLQSEITPRVREEAKKFSVVWRSSLTKQGKAPWEVFGFLQLVAAYKLAQFYARDELLSLLRILYDDSDICQPKQIRHLCGALGLTKQMPGLIKSLIMEGKQIQAIRYICALKLKDNFPPGPLLEAHLNVIQMKCKDVVNKDDAVTTELTSLKAMIKCVCEFDIQSDYPLAPLKSRIKALEKEIEKRKRASKLAKQRPVISTVEQMVVNRPNSEKKRCMAATASEPDKRLKVSSQGSVPHYPEYPAIGYPANIPSYVYPVPLHGSYNVTPCTSDAVYGPYNGPYPDPALCPSEIATPMYPVKTPTPSHHRGNLQRFNESIVVQANDKSRRC